MNFLESGKLIEQEFAKHLKQFDCSNAQQDMTEHWDIKTCIKFDVKGLKKRKRSDEQPDETIHWIELVNVNGEHGWIKGEADYIVFETFDYWIIVNREKLLNFVSRIVDFSTVPELNKLYQRNKDIITMVKTIDLMFMATEILKK